MAKIKKTSRSTVRTKKTDDPGAITTVEYGGVQAAFDHFNKTLFDGKRRAHSMGYFSPDRFAGRVGKFAKHELALNPDVFFSQTDEQICQTWVHEMTHLKQQDFGKPSARGYHNREWAMMMKAVGLQPSSTGAVGGKETGSHMMDYIIPGGPFEQAFKTLASTGWRLNLESAHQPGGSKTPDPSKTKFTCPAYGWIVRGKPDTEVVHKPCGCVMLAERPAIQPYDQAVE